MKRERNTLPKRVKQLSTENVEKAIELGLYGHELTDIEHAIMLFRRWKSSFTKSRDMSEKAAFSEYINRNRQIICEEFLSAIESGDVARIKSLADALQNVKQSELFFSTTSRTAKWRVAALTMKSILDEKKEKWTIEKLAKLVDSDEKENGHKTLRDIAKEINFPIQGK